ncbi:MAG: ABC transporter permease [Flavobacteriales bacterium]|nr:ABC transporter permease [Flavobacteriales bacterium]
MSKIGLVVGREYFSRVKKKSFIAMTILGPLLFVGFFAAAIWVSIADNKNHEVLIVDQDGIFTYVPNEDVGLQPIFPDVFKNSENLQYHFSERLLEDSVFKNSQYTLMIHVAKVYDAKQAEMIYKELPSSMVSNKIERALEAAIERAKVRDSEALDYATYKNLKVNITLTKPNINDSDADSDPELMAGIGIAFGVIIFFFIFLYGSMVMRGVIEEKSNRIVEVIVSSIKPFQLMLGKIIGIGLVGLTQFLIWIGLSFLLFFIVGLVFESGALESVASIDGAAAGAMAPAPVDFQTYLASNENLSFITRINWGLMLTMFVTFFVGGYMLYGSMFASIGAAVDSETDTQQFMLPVMIPLFFSYMISIMSINNPEGFSAKLFSFIPFSSPIVMMTRTPLNSTHWWELILSVVLLIITCVIMIWIAGKIYRTGILMYGKKVSYKEIWKWIKFSN